MSLKLFGDTIRLSEFGNQRFLYGNFLPALYFILTSIVLVFGIDRITIDYFQVFIFMTIAILVLAFINQRFSRYAVYKFCLVERHYKKFFVNDYLKKREKTLFKGVSDREKSIEILKKVAIEDFKKYYNDSFYSTPTTPEAQELWRQETTFLIGLMGSFYSLLCLIISIVFYSKDTFNISFFGSIIPADIHIIIRMGNLSILLSCGVFAIIAGNRIRELLLSALPITIKKDDPRTTVNIKVIKGLRDRYKNEEKLYKELFIKELESDIRLVYRIERNTEIASQRLKESIMMESEISETDQEAIIKGIDYEKVFGQPVSPEEASILNSLMEECKLTADSLIFSTDINGLINKFNLFGLKLLSLPDSISQLTNLTDLVLGNNQLTSLPDFISQLTNLRYLVLDNNRLKSLPDSISQLPNLRTLILLNNQLTSLPDSIGQLTNLETLYLSHNQLTSLPDSIGQLPNLKLLVLDNNRLKSLPDSISQLPNLTDLVLDNNRLVSLPDSISQLPNLKLLVLDNNQLASLPDFIRQQPNLKGLGLSYNQLKSLPDSISQLPNLTDLYLDNNQLASLPDSISQLTNLTELYLSHNQLTSLPDSISQLTNLTELYLDNNQLASLPDSISQLPNLEILYLENNPGLGEKSRRFKKQEILDLFS